MASRIRASSLSSNGTSSSSSGNDVGKVKATRPRLSCHNKRVSFDAPSVPLPSTTWEELASPASLVNPPFPIPQLPVSDGRHQILRKSEVDSKVDLKAVLAAGIQTWREEVSTGM